ncbi:biopolymer transporter ExbD, partial [Akkermansiaceae bacterium]|nr:biopolymer transporter ExbD [Akkermansiaceae bacterium]
MALVRTRRIDAGIDMTPLIDVVFQLLIFLMVSSQFIKPDQRVELPIGPLNSASVDQEFETLTLIIQPDNSLLLEGKETTLEALANDLRDAISHSEITSMEIRGDRESNLGTFIQVMETARD